MSKLTAFVQTHGQVAIREAELPEAATVADLHAAIEAAGIPVDTETLVYVDDAPEPVRSGHPDPVPGLKHGCRVHVGRCGRVSVTVNYLEQSADRAFPPGARVRAVKEWAVEKFRLSPKDAAEHVLQLCGSTARPSSDTPLHQLATPKHPGAETSAQGHGRLWAVCFDLVPDKRVEG